MVNSITHETWQGYVTTTGLLEMTVKILDVIDKENIPYGRAVVTVNSGMWSPAGISQLMCRSSQSVDFPADSYYGKLYHYFFEELDKRGVVVVIAQGNGGYNKVTGTPDHYQGERSPQKFVTDASPFISVGATYHDGSIAEFSTPPGLKPGTSGPNADASVSIWAQGVGVYTCNPKSLVPMGYRSGTSFSAPIVVSPPWSCINLPHGTEMLTVFLYPGWACCLHAVIPLAGEQEPFCLERRSLCWTTREDDAC